VYGRCMFMTASVDVDVVISRRYAKENRI